MCEIDAYRFQFLTVGNCDVICLFLSVVFGDMKKLFLILIFIMSFFLHVGNSVVKCTPDDDECLSMKKVQIPEILPVRLFAGEVVATPDSIAQSEDYVDIPFRVLSKTYIPSHSIDFGEGDVLKNAISLFDKAKVIKSHLESIDSVIGTVFNPVWDESGEVAGINANYRIYKKFGQDVIDKLTLNPPLLDATSAGLQIKWKKSHPDLTELEFWLSLGKEVNGKLVRYIATEIVDVREVSIVFRGADRNAKRLSELQLKEEDFEFYFATLSSQENKYFKSGEETLKLTLLQAQSIGLPKTEILKLGLDKQESVELEQKDFDVIIGLSATIFSENQNLKAERKKDAERIQLGEVYEKSIREDALKKYRALSLEDQDPNIVALLETAHLEVVRSLAMDYGKRLEEKHPVTATRQSSDTGTQIANQNIDIDSVKVGKNV